ncbi:hypothetical protein RQP46_005071 [Phenoliferia psychrophenolica]
MPSLKTLSIAVLACAIAASASKHSSRMVQHQRKDLKALTDDAGGLLSSLVGITKDDPLSPLMHELPSIVPAVTQSIHSSGVGELLDSVGKSEGHLLDGSDLAAVTHPDSPIKALGGILSPQNGGIVDPEEIVHELLPELKLPYVAPLLHALVPAAAVAAATQA